MKELKKVEKYEDKNATWQKNHSIIMDAFDKLYDELGKFPSLQSLSDETGLSINTIHKHSESLTLENVNTKYKLAGERVAKSLLKKIEDTGNAAEVKLYNQIVFGYRESHELTGKDGENLITEIKINIVKNDS